MLSFRYRPGVPLIELGAAISSPSWLKELSAVCGLRECLLALPWFWFELAVVKWDLANGSGHGW